MAKVSSAVNSYVFLGYFQKEKQIVSQISCSLFLESGIKHVRVFNPYGVWFSKKIYYPLKRKLCGTSCSFLLFFKKKKKKRFLKFPSQLVWPSVFLEFYLEWTWGNYVHYCFREFVCVCEQKKGYFAIFFSCNAGC